MADVFAMTGPHGPAIFCIALALSRNFVAPLANF
jgi:hypothetical protein